MLSYNAGRGAEDVIKFVNEKAGTSARLQVAPSDVVTLTADNFDQIVADVTKDVLVEFYAPCACHYGVCALLDINSLQGAVTASRLPPSTRRSALTSRTRNP